MPRPEPPPRTEREPEPHPASDPASWPHGPPPADHAVYGTPVCSDFPFTHHLAAGGGPAEFTLTHRVGETTAPSEEPAWSSSLRAADGTPECHLHRRAADHLLRFHQIGDFAVARHRIDLRLPAPGLEWIAELRLLGPVLAYWLELQGLPALHASAVAHPAGAVAFLASHGGGKSLLAAALMAEAGLPLLADDVVAVEPTAWRARPAYPQMRLAPADAKRLTGRRDLPRVHPQYPKRRVPVGVRAGFGTFEEEPVRLAALYLPVRGAAAVPEVTPLGPAEALLALVEHSFIARLVEGAGLQPRRLAVLARLVETVPVRRLEYPSGREHLPAVVRAVLADLREA